MNRVTRENWCTEGWKRTALQSTAAQWCYDMGINPGAVVVVLSNGIEHHVQQWELVAEDLRLHQLRHQALQARGVL